MLLNTKEKPFEPTKPKSVRSISLLVVWLEGFNHCLSSIGAITQRLHYAWATLQRSEVKMLLTMTHSALLTDCEAGSAFIGVV